jgi:beta-lactamase class A
MTLKDDIQAVIDESQIEAGVAVWHIESGEKVDVNGNQSFPMASTFKIPIIATAFQQINEGTIKLEDRITLRDEDKSIGSGILRYFEGGLNPTFHDLLTLMIIISDNTATDMVLCYR